MYNILSVIFKYIFIIIIYLFIFSIIRLIYLDIRGMGNISLNSTRYLKLINRIDSLPFKMKEYYPVEARLSLGRHGNNNIVVKDPYISKKHFQIVEDEGKYYLEDLASANGTYLNEERVLDAVRLENGNIIRAGQIEFLFVDRDRR